MPGYSGTTVRDVDGVLTNASRMIPPLSAQHLEVNRGSRSTLLVIGPPSEIEPRRICERLAPWARGVTEESILASASSSLFPLRIHSHEGFVSVAQLFGEGRALEQCAVELARADATMLAEHSAVASWFREER